MSLDRTKTYCRASVADVTLADGSEWSVDLWLWLGTSDCPGEPPKISFYANGSEAYQYGASLHLTAASAREMAAALNAAADRIDAGWNADVAK